MELAAGALSSLLPKLGSLLTDEYKLQKGVRGEIRFLQAEMESMEAALKMVSKLPAHQIDDLSKIWVRDLKELVYDIEDSVDAFMVGIDAPMRASPHSFKKFFDRIIGLLTKSKNRHHIADDIQGIKKRIQQVADRREKYRIGDVVARPDDTAAIDPRLSALYQDAKNLVGIDGPAEKITSLLMDGEGVQKQQLMVLCIVGVGGLGKTTLANSVYQRLRGEFQSQAFVSVSVKPDIKKILNSILRQVSKIEKPKAEEWMLTELIDKIRGILEKTRYIIVIDDIWCKTEWVHIKNVLVENNLGNKVIVTTRNADMAEFCCSSVDGAVYELKTLSDADSKRLFCKRIFNKYDGIDSELEEVTQKFLKKCGGIPLAIITISSLLASRPRKSKLEWYDVYNSIGSGHDKYENMENMRGILSLSYHDLPCYLKPCLLYLSMFHEDYEFDKDRLVRLWVAEGFVEDNGRNLYELGEGYFNELANRSMIQPVGNDEYGNVRACYVHDMILDLIISLSTEDNFATRSDSPNMLSSQTRIRRLSLQDSKKYVYSKEGDQVKLLETVDTSHVRSLVGFGDSSKWTPPLSRFSVLRVLDIEGFPSDESHIKNIHRLHHLRYLALKPKNAIDLPDEIGNLQLLKILDLRAARIRQLPESVFQLKHLECLLLPFFVRMPDGIGNLRSLQELSWLDVTKSPNTLAELGKLAEMRILSILGLNSSKVKTFLHSLSSLGQIRSLNFIGSGQCSLDCLPDQWTAPARLRNFDGGFITFCQLPRWFLSLSELSYLSIWVQKLREDDFEMLGALPELLYLDIQLTSDAPTVEERWEIGKIKPFQSLVEFHFTHSTRFWLIFAPGAMPKLQSLGLRFAVVGWNRESDGFLVGLENLVSLKNVSTQVVCTQSQVEEVEDVESRIRDVVGIHPNRPVLELTRWGDPIPKEDEEEPDHEI
ncbi:unnamed protein product [Urochloa humidicola]